MIAFPYRQARANARVQIEPALRAESPALLRAQHTHRQRRRHDLADEVGDVETFTGQDIAFREWALLFAGADPLVDVEMEGYLHFFDTPAAFRQNDGIDCAFDPDPAVDTSQIEHDMDRTCEAEVFEGWNVDGRIDCDRPATGAEQRPAVDRVLVFYRGRHKQRPGVQSWDPRGRLIVCGPAPLVKRSARRDRGSGGRSRLLDRRGSQMGFNIIGALTGAAEGFALGGPGGAIAGALGGGALGSGSPIDSTGNVDNGLLSGWESNVLAQQDMLNQQMAYFQLGVQKQANEFNMMTDEKSELQRETNTLRQVAMEQRKADIGIMRDFIRSIG